MACYVPFDNNYPFAWIEQNIFDNDELSSFTPIFCYPMDFGNQVRSAVIFEPIALMYQESLDGSRYYVLHPVSWTKSHSSYHLVTTELYDALSYKTVSAKRNAILKLIKLCEDQVETKRSLYN